MRKPNSNNTIVVDLAEKKKTNQAKCLYADFFATIPYFGPCSSLNCPQHHGVAALQRVLAGQRALRKLARPFTHRTAILRLCPTASFQEIRSLTASMTRSSRLIDRHRWFRFCLHQTANLTHLHICVASKMLELNSGAVKFQNFMASLISQCVISVDWEEDRNFHCPIDWLRYVTRQGHYEHLWSPEEKLTGCTGHCFRERNKPKPRPAHLRFSPKQETENFSSDVDIPHSKEGRTTWKKWLATLHTVSLDGRLPSPILVTTAQQTPTVYGSLLWAVSLCRRCHDVGHRDFTGRTTTCVLWSGHRQGRQPATGCNLSNSISHVLHPLPHRDTAWLPPRQHDLQSTATRSCATP